MTQITIARATPRDVERIAPLFDAYRTYYGQPSDLDGARRFIEERLANEESVIFLAVASESESERAVGFTQLYPMFTSVGMRRTWLLNDLFVAPEARRGGVARLLMNAARDLAVATDAARLELATAKDNWGAKTLYESLGYQLDDAFDHYSLPIAAKDQSTG